MRGPSEVKNNHNAARAKNPTYMEAPNPVISRLASSFMRLFAVIVHNNTDNPDPSRGVA